MRPDAPQRFSGDIGRVQGDPDGEGCAETCRGMDVLVSESEAMTVSVTIRVVTIRVVMIVVVMVRMVVSCMIMRRRGVMMVVIAGVVGI